MSIDHLSLGKLNLQQMDVSGKQKAEVAGEQFEGYLLQMMVREMRKTVPEGMFDSQAMSVFMDLFDQAIAEEMASAGGLGFSESIQNAIKAQSGDHESPMTHLGHSHKDKPIISPSESMSHLFHSIARPLAKRSGEIPVQGRLTSDFGDRFHPIKQEHRHHDGIDIGAPRGTDIQAVADGVITFSGRQGGYGNVVIVDHGDGWKTKYAHCDSINVQKGDVVSASQTIAAVGSTGVSTGPHLHFEVEHNGKKLNPMKVFDWKF